MQMQDYLPFFQELSLQYYQFTLENAVYAACLAIVVWLLTAIFYSFRIGFLNRRNRITLKANIDAQNAVSAAQQEIQQLQAEVAAGKEQLEQEAQRTAALQERIGGLASQLSESIVALAAQPDLGQQGLSVAPGLEVEHLWQRYSAAVKQIGEGLIAQRRANNELQQACAADQAKLAEKDSQLQATQTRLDSQRQQLAKLEQAVEEQKTQLLQQQESAQQRLAEVEARHQADLARLAVSGQQPSLRTSDKQPQPALQETPKVQEAPVARPEPIKPVEIKSEPLKAARLEPEPQAVRVEPKPVVTTVAPAEPSIARAEATKQKQPAAKAQAEAAAGVGGKFKSWFSGAKQQMEKLDDMFGLNTPMLPPEEPREAIHAHRAPQDSPVVVETPVREPEVKVPERQEDAAAKDSAAGLTGKFKNLFGSSKAAPVAEPAAVEKTVEPVVEAPQVITPAAEAIQGDDAPGKAPGKFKNLFGKFKGKA